jgi:hypothetical protein
MQTSVNRQRTLDVPIPSGNPAKETYRVYTTCTRPASEEPKDKLVRKVLATSRSGLIRSHKAALSYALEEVARMRRVYSMSEVLVTASVKRIA